MAQSSQRLPKPSELLSPKDFKKFNDFKKTDSEMMDKWEAVKSMRLCPRKLAESMKIDFSIINQWLKLESLPQGKPREDLLYWFENTVLADVFPLKKKGLSPEVKALAMHEYDNGKSIAEVTEIANDYLLDEFNDGKTKLTEEEVQKLIDRLKKKDKE